VHDENAFAIGGVSGHAGVFSTAADLAVFCQMLLNGGVVRAPADSEARDYRRVHAAATAGAKYAYAGLGGADRRQL